MRIPCVCVVALLSAVSSAQTTHIVGPGGFAQVNDALAVAAPGDEIVVQPGTYGAFTATFDVTIRAVSSGTVTIGIPSFLLTPNRVSLIGGEIVHLVNLGVRGLEVIGGTIALDSCQVTSASAYEWPIAISAQSASIVLQHCEIIGGTQWGSGVIPKGALTATSSSVTAIDSTFRGGSTYTIGDGPHPSYGILLNDSPLYGSHLIVSGGGGSGYYYLPLPAVRVNGFSPVWISDSTLNGGVQVFSTTLPPSCPIWTPAGRLDRCTLVPNCPLGIPTTGPLLGLHRPAPMASPGAVALEFRAAANEPVGAYLSTGLGAATLPLFEQPILLDIANAVPFALLVTDAAGLATTGCSIPAGFAGLEFWFQGVSGATLPLLLSPVAGGIVR